MIKLKPWHWSETWVYYLYFHTFKRWWYADDLIFVFPSHILQCFDVRFVSNESTSFKKIFDKMYFFCVWGVLEPFHNSTYLMHVYNISRTITYQSGSLRQPLIHYHILYSVLHFLSLLKLWFSWLWFVLCTVFFQDICSVSLCFVFLMLLNIFCLVCLSFMSAFFAAPAQGEPGGVNQSASDAEAGQIQWRSQCFSFGLHPAH